MVKQNEQRRLAAIFAADMVGYSRLMEADERGTIARQRAHRAELIDPKITEYHGRIVKLMGDGMLVEFASVVDAVQCAVVIQEAMGEREADQPSDQSIRYRIGVNVGDIVIDGDDILGDGVNIAARLEGLADPGGVAISAIAFEQTQGKLTVSFEDGGEHEVKNLSRPVRVWRWHGDGKTRVVSANRNIDSSLKSLIESIEQPALAVLPFVNMSRDEELEFFCDGLTESLITDLSRGARLSVAARNSSFAFKGQAIDVHDAATKLGVRYLIEGSVQAMGSRLRVNAQLIDSTTGNHIWADRFDRSTDDLFAAQDELCVAILVETDSALSAGESARVRSTETNNTDATRHIQRASIFFGQQNYKGFLKAQKEADEAAEIDPNFSSALMYQVAARAQQVLHGWAADRDALLDEAMMICEDAIARQPDSSRIKAVRSLVYLVKGEFDLAILDGEASVEALPNIGAFHHFFARSLIATERFDEAYRESIAAIKLQPNAYPFYVLSLGVICLLRGRYDEAVLVLTKYRQMAPHLAEGITMLAAALWANEQEHEARQVVDAVMEMDPNIVIDDVLRPYPMRNPMHREKLASFLNAAGMRA